MPQGTIGEYELEELIGRGGMAQVFRARHKKTGDLFALKLLLGPSVLDDTIAQRFRREAEVIQTIRHPGVVRLVDFGLTADRRNYLVMEWVEGRQLSAAISTEAPFAPARAADITRKIAAGLGAIHLHEFVHRDLKPQNIILTGPDESGLKIIDFGLVSSDVAMWERLTRTGEIVGTPLYMAPESIEGVAVDARTDLYSLGIILYEMLTGQPPFSSPSIPEILDWHLSRAPALLPDLGGLDRLAHALLEKKPAMRPADHRAVIAVIDALDLATGPVPVPAKGVAKTRGQLAETMALPHAGTRTAEGPLTQPFPVQTWQGERPAPDRSDSGAQATIRIPLGRSDTELENSGDVTAAMDDPTAALDVSVFDAPERTASFSGISDSTQLKPRPRTPVPVASTAKSLPPPPVHETARRANLRRLVLRATFFVVGAMLAALALHFARKKEDPISIPAVPTPKAKARTANDAEQER